MHMMEPFLDWKDLRNPKRVIRDLNVARSIRATRDLKRVLRDPKRVIKDPKRVTKDPKKVTKVIVSQL